MPTSESFLGRLAGLVPAGLLCVYLDVTPVPAARPRVARNGGVYYPAAYSNYLAECKRKLVLGGAMPKASGDLVVVVESVARKPRTSKMTAPTGDVDNLCKGPLDAAKSLLWEDDKQIVALVTTKRWASDGEEPHVKIHYGSVE